MKKFLSLLLAAFLIVLCFSGCKKTEKDGKDKSDEQAIPSLKRVYVLNLSGNSNSISLSSSFQTDFEKNGGSIISEYFAKETKDFSDYLAKAEKYDCDAVFFAAPSDYAVNFLKSYKNNKLTCPVIATKEWNTPKILKAVSDSKATIYYSTFFNKDDKKSAEFVKGFNKYLKSDKKNLAMNGGNNAVSELSAFGYDTYNLLFSAIKKIAKAKVNAFTSVDLAESVFRIRFTDAVAGKFVFDYNGDAVRTSANIFKFENGGFEYLKKQTVSQKQVGDYPDFSDLKGISPDTVNKKIVIGVCEPLSGLYAKYGKKELLGIKYANALNNSIKIGGENYSVELAVADNLSSTDGAASSMAEIMGNNPLAVIGSYEARLSEIVFDSCEQAQIPAICVCNEDRELTMKHSLSLRTCLSDDTGTFLSQFTLDLINE